MPTNKSIIVVVTVTLAIMAATCIATICFLAYKGIEVPPELNTLAGGLVGMLGSMLVKTSPSETTKSQESAAIKEIVSGAEPAKVEVVNPIDNPVNTEETK